jgi:aminoglycoside phosphotransferase (APT) family kinase protein
VDVVSPELTDDVASIGPVLALTWGVAQVEISSVRRLSAGASRLSWAFDAHDGDHVRRLVIQRERVKGHGNSDVDVEARLLSAARNRGVPVPEVVMCDPIGEAMGGAFIVVSRVEGETIPRKILRREDLSAARAGFATECGRILAAIHAIDVREVEPLPEPSPIDAIQCMLDASGQPRPAFELGLRWLVEHPPSGARRTVVHGDFRNGNLIVGPSGIAAVLDWELAHVGNPVEDLGWLCARSWRWGASPEVGGMGTRSDLLRAYADAGGGQVSEGDFFWWQLLAAVRWGVMCLEQARTHLSGEARSVELAVLGRCAAEIEYDVMRMLP